MFTAAASATHGARASTQSAQKKKRSLLFAKEHKTPATGPLLMLCAGPQKL